MKTTKIILLLAGIALVSGTANAQYYQKSALTTGIGPKYFAYNSDSGKIYVSNTGESTIGILKNYTYQPLTLAFGPSEMEYNPLTRKLYVGMGSGSVYILNGDDDQLDTTLTVSTMGVQLACNSVVNKLYVSSSGYGLYIYNGSTYSLLNFFTGFEGNLYYFPGQQTYVAHSYDSLIGVIRRGRRRDYRHHRFFRHKLRQRDGGQSRNEEAVCDVAHLQPGGYCRCQHQQSYYQSYGGNQPSGYGLQPGP